jgi:hypothetical protein
MLTRFYVHSICCLLILSMLVPHRGLGNVDPVRNVSVTVEGDMIEIRYDLVPEDAEGKYTVSIEVSDDGGLTYAAVPRMITGDLGRDIVPGIQKRIVWFVERNFPGGIDIDRYDIRITAKRQGINRNILYAILGAVVAGGGAAAYFLLGGNGNDTNSDFASPPGRPE